MDKSKLSDSKRKGDFMKSLTVIGRLLFSVLFIFSGFSHFSAATLGYAASQGVPFAEIIVPLSGMMAILGGLSILLGYQAKYGALILVVFLVPVTFMMHAFWNLTDPMVQQMQMIMFMKNLALTGTALFIIAVGSGPLSLDNREKANARVGAFESKAV